MRDAGERLVVPGFVDPHVHLHHLAVGTGRGVDCRVPRCAPSPTCWTPARRAGVAAGDWLIGYGNLFFDQKIAETAQPTRAELDAVSDASTDRPAPRAGTPPCSTPPPCDWPGVERFMSGAAGGWGSPGRRTGRARRADRAGGGDRPDAAHPARWTATASTDYLEATYRDQFTRRGVTAFGEMAESREAVDSLDRLIAGGRLRHAGLLT